MSPVKQNNESVPTPGLFWHGPMHGERAPEYGIGGWHIELEVPEKLGRDWYGVWTHPIGGWDYSKGLPKAWYVYDGTLNCWVHDGEVWL